VANPPLARSQENDMNLWHDLEPTPVEDDPSLIHVVVEIPFGGHLKYELHKPTGAIKLDRVLHSAVYYPGDYGFVPQTYYDDYDPLDVLVITNNPTFPGCIVEARPIGVFHLMDKGLPDDKIIAVLNRDPYYTNIHDLENLPPHQIREITHFFEVYKELEGGGTRARGWGGREDAMERIRYGIEMYKKGGWKVGNASA